MNYVEITASRNYHVAIGSGVLERISDTIAATTKAKRVCIISDKTVFSLYGSDMVCRLQNNAYTVSHFIIAPGEASKNSGTYLEILDFLAESGLDRNDCILALGGGVVGDLAGFAAATYLRGIAYIQIPTTLLAMVDSSVGGKTGINLAAGKNLCGAFWHPVAVLCDTDTLNTLPKQVLRDGCAEVIKYAVLFDNNLFAHLETHGLEFDRQTVISRCIELKRDAVASDERDQGERMLLNLGHTFGHAIEACSQYSISHGCAVAIGMAMVSRAICCPDTARITALLEKFGLPTTVQFDPLQIASCALADKKRSGNSVNLIVPKAIGHCTVQAIPVEHMKTMIEEGI